MARRVPPQTFVSHTSQLNTWSANQTFNDCIRLFLGTCNDGAVYYDGTDLIIDPSLVGCGDLNIIGGTALDLLGLAANAVNLPAAGNIRVNSSNQLSSLMLMAAGAKGTSTTGAGDSNKLSESRELATNDINIHFMAFDKDTAETAFWNIPMPDGYDGGTITATFYWTAAAGTGTVTWTIAARAFANDEALDQAQGTGISTTDTLLATDDVHVSPVSSAVTIGGTPAGGEFVVWEVTRTISDTLTADAQLLAVKVEFGRNAFSD